MNIINKIKTIANKLFATIKKQMEEPKTIWQVLEESLPKEAYQKAQKYIYIRDAAQPCTGGIDQATTSFRWSETEEGREYWANVFNAVTGK